MKDLREKEKGYRAFTLGGGAVTLAALFALILGAASCSNSAGYDDDDAAVTYTVSTAEELLEWNAAAQANPNASCILEDNIDMEGYVWTPVGDEDNPYAGTFDGRGHVISNLNIQGSAKYAGLVGYVGSEGWVKNLALKDATIFGRDSFVGGIAGYNRGTISFCYVTDSSVTGPRTYVGGIAGYNNGSIIGCYYTGDVTGGEHVGGFAGNTYLGYITSSYSVADVLGSASSTCGGFLGVIAASYDYTVDCYWDGSVNEDSGTDILGIGSGSSSGLARAGDNGNESWTNAVDAMNERIAQYGWKYELDADSGLPYLTNGL